MGKHEEIVQYKPIKKGFRASMLNCHYTRYPIEYFFRSMQLAGFTEIELFGCMPQFYLEDVNDALIDRVRAGAERYGLRILGFTPAQGVYPVSISVNEEAPRRRSIDMAKKAIDTAVKLGASSISISPGFGYESEPFEIRWGLCRDALTELGEYAAVRGILILLEPLTTPTSNVVNTSAQSAQMLREVHSPQVKSIMDIGVLNYMGETVEEYFDNLGEDLRMVHFTDGPGAHVALGDGSFPMVEYAEQILRQGFQGRWVFEINDKRYQDHPDAATNQNVLWLKQHGFSD